VVLIKNKIIYSILTVVLLFALMTFVEMYREKKLVSNYEDLTLKQYKKENFKLSSDGKKRTIYRIEIQVGGAVKNPGFHEIISGIKVKRLIDEYIILKNDADLSKVDLEQKLYDNDKIIIPPK